jgi:hypothetical protein
MTRVNNEIEKPFFHLRDLPQDNPLTLLLFILVTDTPQTFMCYNLLQSV